MKEKIKEATQSIGIIICGLLITAAIAVIIYGVVYGMCYNENSFAPTNEATVNIYTSDGELIKSYHGDIQYTWSDSTVIFTYDGKKYIYSNCQVEYISNK